MSNNIGPPNPQKFASEDPYQYASQPTRDITDNEEETTINCATIDDDSSFGHHENLFGSQDELNDCPNINFNPTTESTSQYSKHYFDNNQHNEDHTSDHARSDDDSSFGHHENLFGSQEESNICSTSNTTIEDVGQSNNLHSNNQQNDHYYETPDIHESVQTNDHLFQSLCTDLDNLEQHDDSIKSTTDTNQATECKSNTSCSAFENTMDRAQRKLQPCDPVYVDRIRVLTWNVANKFHDGESFRRLFLAGKYSAMALQEPVKKYHPKTIKFLVSNWQKNCIILIPSPLQYFLIQEETIGNGIIGRPKIFLDGRIISVTFISNFESFTNKDDQIVTIIAVYGVTSNDNEYVSGLSRKSLRQQVQSTLDEHIRTTNNMHPNQHIIIMGDMQDTITTKPFDNSVPSHAKERKKEGILALKCNPNHNFESVVHREYKEKGFHTYITRQSNLAGHNARGLSHICCNKKATEMYLGGGIDRLTSEAIIPSDHFLIHAENIQFNRIATPSDLQWTSRYMYPKIASIPLADKYSLTAEEPEFNDTLFLNEENREAKNRLNHILQVANDEDNNPYSYLISAEKIMSNLEDELKTAHIREEAGQYHNNVEYKHK